MKKINKIVPNFQFVRKREFDDDINMCMTLFIYRENKSDGFSISINRIEHIVETCYMDSCRSHF